MKVGDLFTLATVETRPCVHCGEPAVEVDGETLHFEAAENGAKTAWLECFTVVRGRRKYTGTMAEVAS